MRVHHDTSYTQYYHIRVKKCSIPLLVLARLTPMGKEFHKSSIWVEKELVNNVDKSLEIL